MSIDWTTYTDAQLVVSAKYATPADRKAIIAEQARRTTDDGSAARVERLIAGGI